MISLTLHKNVTSDKLIKAGFKRQSENKMLFRFREKLYKDTISLSIKIDLSEEDDDEKIEWHVIDNNTGLSYNTFYFTPNTNRDLVRENVLKTFKEIIEELNKREVIYMEDC